MRVLSLCLIAVFLVAVNAQEDSYENPFSSMEGPEDFGSMEWDEKGGKKGKKMMKMMKSGANPFGVEEFGMGMRVMDSDDDKEHGHKKKGGMKKGDKKGDSANPFGDMRVSSGSVNIALPSMAPAAPVASVAAAATALPNGIPAAGTILGRASGLNNWQAGSNWGGSYTPYSAAPAAWGAVPYARAATTANWATSNWAAPAAAATTSTWASTAAPAATVAATSNWAAPVSTRFNNWAPATSNLNAAPATSNWNTNWNAAPATSNWNTNWNAAPATNFNNWGFNGNNGNRFQSFGFGR